MGLFPLLYLAGICEISCSACGSSTSRNKIKSIYWPHSCIPRLKHKAIFFDMPYVTLRLLLSILVSSVPSSQCVMFLWNSSNYSLVSCNVNDTVVAPQKDIKSESVEVPLGFTLYKPSLLQQDTRFLQPADHKSDFGKLGVMHIIGSHSIHQHYNFSGKWGKWNFPG